ncbi:hypothetical protein Hypma_006889 [Hypsizygus marmoreus]|uniref:C2H2-type domain-containing protein n=1 Tax=Hypsizygus marmoreus TaxID=39966 RepID=A0A369JZA4_HYPMA|nr:hypothetical protein Hypma_006889 [Hypsizygus marmoreus]
MNDDQCPILVIPGTPPPFDNSQFSYNPLQDLSPRSPTLRVWPSSPGGSPSPLQGYFIDLEDSGISGYSAEHFDNDWSASYGQLSRSQNTVYSSSLLTPSPTPPTLSSTSMSPVSRMLDTFSFDDPASPIISSECDWNDEQDVLITSDASIYQKDLVHDDFLPNNHGPGDDFLEALFPPDASPFDDFLQHFEESIHLSSPQIPHTSAHTENLLNSSFIQIRPNQLRYSVDVDYSAPRETLYPSTQRIVSSISTTSSSQHTRSLSASSAASVLSSSSQSPVSPYSRLSPTSPTDSLLSPTEAVPRSDGLQRRHSHSNGSSPSPDHHAHLRRTRSSTAVRNRSPYARPQELPQTHDSLMVPSPVHLVSIDHVTISSASSSSSLSREASMAPDDQIEESTPPYDMFRDTIASEAVLLASARRRKKPANFSCHICSQLLTSKDNLNNHLDAHEGIRRHKCEHCPESFRTRSVLKRHQKSIKCPGSHRLKDAQL